MTARNAELPRIERLEPIAWLAEQTGLPLDTAELQAHESRAKQLYTDHGVVPPIGCEVEVTWAARYPELFAQHFSQLDSAKTYTTVNAMVQDLSPAARQAFEAHKLEIIARDHPRYQETVAAGIPRGKDAFWEFAHQPSYAWQTLASEVDYLMQTGMIPEGKYNSLHVTLGGVALGRGGAQLILAGLELCSVPPERILAATKTKLHSWARHATNKGGVRERSGQVVQLGQVVATEFRTLATASPEDHGQSLHTAQMLGAVLMAHRVRSTDQHEVIAEIGNLWPAYAGAFNNLWEARGLPTDQSWGSPFHNPEPWRGWAESLARRDETDSPEQEALQTIKGITTATEQLLAVL